MNFLKRFRKTTPVEADRSPLSTEDDCKRYIFDLLSLKVRLIEIPLRVLRDQRYCWGIYISAFRADRATTKKQYLLDLAFLDVEIELARDRGEFDLRDTLRRIQEDASWGLETFNKK